MYLAFQLRHVPSDNCRQLAFVRQRDQDQSNGEAILLRYRFDHFAGGDEPPQGTQL